MSKQTTIVALAAAALALAGCSKEQAAEEQPAQVTLNEVMKNQIDKHADELWDVTNAALGPDAALDPAKMDDKRWADIVRLAGEVETGAKQLAALDPIVVVKDGEKIADEDVPFGDKAVDVQASIDKDPQGLRDLANSLAGHMADLIVAANAKDVKAASPLINDLDGVCESCHINYWYPSQKAVLEKYASAGVIDNRK